MGQEGGAGIGGAATSGQAGGPLVCDVRACAWEGECDAGRSVHPISPLIKAITNGGVVLFDGNEA
eukprot:2622040-Prymnesium_polylepis.2